MKALITGASSGLGRDMARALAKRGIDLIIIARRKDRLQQLQEELDVAVTTITLDLSVPEHCMMLYERIKHEHIDILINNAGFGLFGSFDETSLERELNMIDLNIKAVHILTKLFVNHPDIKYIMNVASSAAFLPGPLMAAYYASKSYVYRLTLAVAEELRKKKSPIHMCVLCPGPVKTEFNQVADVSFQIPSLSSEYVAELAVEQMFQRKSIIIPGMLMKVSNILSRLTPNKVLVQVSYHLQSRKKEHTDS